ncbi:single-stranded-DNA-specific exonuclease RecJ [Natronobiforma cellulositropha]|uniref:single-stranded-DNA-specific exonuclease RecJ n=1 Tax=Natronobiforma cellulositropha TaxID=1679076 RepID=UPI0021D59690|nr:DHH family phosphoesterase [Natronobiforma cellulositropha]
MTGPVPELADRAVACAQRLLETDRVLLASHIDADGLTSAAVAAQALERAGIPFEAVFEKQLDEAAIAGIAAREYDTVLFTDFGSGQLDVIADYERRGAFTPVIADHHQPAETDTEYHLNPLLVGLNGASELSGAGASYVLARALAAESECEIEHENRDLAALAVVGAVGDMQASSGELHGANAGIVAEGETAGVLETGPDLSLYGKQTRPLPKLLEYASDVRIPGISNDANGALRFLDGLDLELTRDGEWRCWSELTSEEKQVLASALVRRAVSRGVPAGRIDGLVSTAYVLSDEPVGSELRDASEFSTLLNATARYERADVGLGVCLGNREGALERARTLLRDHRRNLSAGIDLVTREGVTVEDNLQWFHAGDRIRETIVGIVAGMALGNGGISREKPILAFAAKNDDELKVSARGTHALVGRGLDLSAVVGEAARAVGGDGGGHDVAAGATVPKGEEEAFLERADAIVGEQLG